MFATPESQLYKNQYDSLFEDTEKNPYLKSSKVASKNKALKFKDDTGKKVKNVVNAINANKEAIDALTNTTVTQLASQNTKIGNLDGDPELYEAFQATGYSNLAEGIINLHEKTTTDVKNIVFVFPKVNTSTIFPELYIPFDMHLENVTVRFSVEDNQEMETFTNNIKVVLQHTSNDNPTEFTTFKEVVMENTNQNSFISVNFTEDDEIRDLPAGIMKARITEFPDNIKNVNIVVSATKANI